MGIPSYFAYIAKRYKNHSLCVDIPSKEVGRFFLDLNGIIHPCSHRVIAEWSEAKKPIVKNELEAEIGQRVVLYIQQMVQFVAPTELVYIAIDGVAPRAKMFQQRKRRFKSAQDKVMDPSLKGKKALWDSNAITPGTAFMDHLGKTLRHSSVLKGMNVPKILISDSSIAGEGEHKLIDYMRTNPQTLNKTDVIHGLDADLIMLSVLQYPNSVHLLRDDTEKKRRFFLDTTSLASSIQRHFDSVLDMKIDIETLLREYVFLCFFMGNDFLPHHYSLEIRDEGIDHVMDAYAYVKNKHPHLYFTTKDAKMNYAFFIEFVTKLAMDEDDLVHKRMMQSVFKQSIRHGHTEQDKFNYFPDYHRGCERYIHFGEDGWRDRYYEKVASFMSPEMVTSQSFRSTMVYTYVQGLIWNLHYYISGCYSTTWYYPYLHAPLLSDLLGFVRDHMTQDMMNTCLEKCSYSYSPFQQLLLVLPPQSSHLVPKSWKHVMQNTMLYPRKFMLDTIGSVFRWQCPPILYHYPDDFFLRVVSNQTLTFQEKKRGEQHFRPFIIKK